VTFIVELQRESDSRSFIVELEKEVKSQHTMKVFGHGKAFGLTVQQICCSCDGNFCQHCSSIPLTCTHS